MQERYKVIEESDQNSRYHGESESDIETFLNQGLSETLEAFDPLFCRKCMVNTLKLSCFCNFLLALCFLT